jgi:hypothetical protein
MNLMETSGFQDLSQSADFEDITMEVFATVDNHLDDLELICAPGFNFEETMTGFELMDKKMDMRASRNEINHSVIESFEKDCQLTDIQKLALMRELLLEMATW